MLQLLKHLRSRSHEITDGYILKWANRKVKNSGRTSEMESYKVRYEEKDVLITKKLFALNVGFVNVDAG